MKVIYEKKTDDLYYRDGSASPLHCSAHLHYYVEIVYMREGYAKAYIDSDVFEINTGDLLVIFPNRIHRFEDKEYRNQYDLFIVNPDIVSELSERIAAENPQNPVIKNVAKNERLLSLIKILSDVKNSPLSYRESLIKGYFLAFFSEVLEMLPMRSNKPDENQAMRTVIQYCSRNFTKDLSLTILEEELHLSKYYISHLFGDKLGMKFNDYINSLRISESCRLLRMYDMSITEISDASGFGTLRTFNRAFIKQMGMSPSEYKKSNRGDDVVDINPSIPPFSREVEEHVADSCVCPEESISFSASFNGDSTCPDMESIEIDTDLRHAGCDWGYPINILGIDTDKASQDS